MIRHMTALVGALSLVGCASLPPIVDSSNLQAKIPLTTRLQEECRTLEPSVGESKTSIIIQSNIEIEDCESKRGQLQELIDTHNTKVEEENAKELEKISNT